MSAINPTSLIDRTRKRQREEDLEAAKFESSDDIDAVASTAVLIPPASYPLFLSPKQTSTNSTVTDSNMQAPPTNNNSFPPAYHDVLREITPSSTAHKSTQIVTGLPFANTAASWL